MKYNHTSLILKSDAILDGELANTLEQGWELISMAPYRMVAWENGTFVEEYLITLRQPAPEVK